MILPSARTLKVYFQVLFHWLLSYRCFPWWDLCSFWVLWFLFYFEAMISVMCFCLDYFLTLCVFLQRDCCLDFFPPVLSISSVCIYVKTSLLSLSRRLFSCCRFSLCLFCLGPPALHTSPWHHQIQQTILVFNKHASAAVSHHFNEVESLNLLSTLSSSLSWRGSSFSSPCGRAIVWGWNRVGGFCQFTANNLKGQLCCISVTLKTAATETWLPPIQKGFQAGPAEDLCSLGFGFDTALISYHQKLLTCTSLFQLEI